MIEYAFKCNNCGALEPPGAAGELDRPAKCHVCGKGAHFDPDTGVRVLDPENWTVLAELQGDELAALHEFHKFDPELHSIVAPGAPLPAADPERVPVNISVEAADGVSGTDVLA